MPVRQKVKGLEVVVLTKEVKMYQGIKESLKKTKITAKDEL